MNDTFFEELRMLLSSGFTGQVVLHVSEGTVKRYEVHEWRRPKAENGTVELTEAVKGGRG